MTERPQTTGDDRSRDTSADGFRRRELVALGAGASATLLAGCAGDGALPSSGGSDGSDGSGDSDDEDDEEAGETDDGTENETDADGTNQTDADGAQNETATGSGD